MANDNPAKVSFRDVISSELSRNRVASPRQQEEMQPLNRLQANDKQAESYMSMSSQMNSKFQELAAP